jgi:hypothetical protein
LFSPGIYFLCETLACLLAGREPVLKLS